MSCYGSLTDPLRCVLIGVRADGGAHDETVLRALMVCCPVSSPNENDLFDHSSVCEQPKLYMHS